MKLGGLLTFGYQGLGGAGDLRRLFEGTGVEAIVDVRLQPFGRVPFRGPTATRLLVESVGLSYVHLPDLGNVLYRTGGIQIRNLEAIESVLTMLRAGRSVALMCACARPEKCHRLTLAEEAVRRLPGLQVMHMV